MLVQADENERPSLLEIGSHPWLTNADNVASHEEVKEELSKRSIMM